MAQKFSQKVSSSNKPKETKVEISNIYEYSLDRFFGVSEKTDRILERKIKLFITRKTNMPPLLLPKGMNDHKLDSPLGDCSECHLRGNILLIYRLRYSILKLIYVCDHDELKGSGIAKLILPHLN